MCSFSLLCGLHGVFSELEMWVAEMVRVVAACPRYFRRAGDAICEGCHVFFAAASFFSYFRKNPPRKFCPAALAASFFLGF